MKAKEVFVAVIEENGKDIQTLVNKWLARPEHKEWDVISIRISSSCTYHNQLMVHRIATITYTGSKARSGKKGQAFKGQKFGVQS